MSRYSFFLILGILSLTIAACSGTSDEIGNDTASDEAPAESAAPAGPDHSYDITFANHLQAGMNEQDVYLLEDGQAMRMTPDQMNDESLLSQVVYKTAGAQEHDPMNLGESPMGPFEAGEALPFTMEEWLGATGSGSYVVADGRGSFDLDFQGLVPGGLYTLWCAEMHTTPSPKIYDYPCGAPDGSENVFEADDSGNASFQLDADALPASTDEVIQIVAAAYHSDDKSHGALPGDFGSLTHVQLMHMLPAPSADESAVGSVDSYEFALGTGFGGGKIEQDVYLMADGKATRLTPDMAEADDSLLSQPVYRTREGVARNGEQGAWEAGGELGFTMEEWLAASGAGSYTVDGEDATLSLRFDNLVPDGLYTLWCAEKHTAPEPKVVQAPCGARDGSQNAFYADGSGKGSITLDMPALPETTDEVIQIIAAAYHSDDKNHGEIPGDFGSQTHVQLMHALPAPEIAVSQN